LPDGVTGNPAKAGFHSAAAEFNTPFHVLIK